MFLIALLSVAFPLIPLTFFLSLLFVYLSVLISNKSNFVFASYFSFWCGVLHGSVSLKCIIDVTAALQRTRSL